MTSLPPTHAVPTSLRSNWAEHFSSKFCWTDFGTDLVREFVSIRLRQTPGVVRLDSKRYITELASEIFSAASTQSMLYVPARPELSSLVDDTVRRKNDQQHDPRPTDALPYDDPARTPRAIEISQLEIGVGHPIILGTR
eukprot:6214398-Pleurochrysis_carterae.AAC.3